MTFNSKDKDDTFISQYFVLLSEHFFMKSEPFKDFYILFCVINYFFKNQV